MDRSSDSINSEFPKEKVPITEKLKNAISNVFVNKEKYIEKDAFDHPWDDAMCLALKMEIEAKPECVDVDNIITETYNRLIKLLGPHDLVGVNLGNIKNRIVFTDPDTLTSFRYLYEQPGENSDKYWENPLKRIVGTRDIEDSVRIISTQAITYGNLKMVMIPNIKATLINEEDIHKQYVEKQGISQFDYPELVQKRIIAHELVHFLYPEGLKPHRLLNEQITDYIATLVFPEIQGVDVRLAWAKASIEDYLNKLEYQSVAELIQPNQKNKEQPHERLIDVSISVRQKYFSKMNYQDMGWPEETLNRIGLSKYSPIPQ